MQNMSDRDSQQDLVQTAYNYASNSIPWWNSCGPHILLYPTTTNLFSNMNSLVPNQTTEVGNQMAQVSSPTQSNGSSHGELSKESDDNPNELCLSTQSGSIHDKTNDKGSEHAHEQQIKEGQTKPTLPEGKSQVFFEPTKFDHSQSLPYVPYAYADTHYTGGLAAFGSHAIVHPQVIGMPPSSRFALPLQPAGEEPIYVNAKQYHAILRRREHRAKLESKNKTLKVRKPYLHESRHQHAIKRARGTGGRFLNTKKLQDQHSHLSSNAAGVQHLATSSERKTGGATGPSALNIPQHHDHGASNSTSATPCSGKTRVLNSGGPRGMLQSQHLLLGFSSSDGRYQFERSIHEGCDGFFNNGPKLRVPVNR